MQGESGYKARAIHSLSTGNQDLLAILDPRGDLFRSTNGDLKLFPSQWGAIIVVGCVDYTDALEPMQRYLEFFRCKHYSVKTPTGKLVS